MKFCILNILILIFCFLYVKRFIKIGGELRKIKVNILRRGGSFNLEKNFFVKNVDKKIKEINVKK